MAQLAYFLRRNSLSPVYWLEIVPRSDFQIVYTVFLITTIVGGYSLRNLKLQIFPFSLNGEIIEWSTEREAVKPSVVVYARDT